jgi:hypothetical protein
MDKWLTCYKNIVDTLDELDRDLLFFRGHADDSWTLLPTLARMRSGNIKNSEQVTYFDFHTRAGDLLPDGSSPWHIAFAMQHHGLPTRLLDWTESFAVALYFALKGAKGNACVWVLDPFKLNEILIGRSELFRPQDLDYDYDEYFISETKQLLSSCVAISPLRHHPRVFHQRAGFTVHNELQRPLEELCPKALTKLNIPKDTHLGAEQFLKLAGISEFTLFPDLDGLARELVQENFES